MMPVALLPLLFPAGPVAPGLTRSKARVERWECERVPASVAAERHPGRVRPNKPDDDPDRSVVVCAERVLRDGLRDDRDEAVLRELRTEASRHATAVQALRPALDQRRWMVEVHYPHGEVAHKIGFATKHALVEQGLEVSDRQPLLGASDLAVITRMPLPEALPTACRRYHDSGALGPDDALLSVVHLDRRSTTLQTGLCVDGHWAWLP